MSESGNPLLRIGRRTEHQISQILRRSYFKSSYSTRIEQPRRAAKAADFALELRNPGTQCQDRVPQPQAGLLLRGQCLRAPGRNGETTHPAKSPLAIVQLWRLPLLPIPFGARFPLGFGSTFRQCLFTIVV